MYIATNKHTHTMKDVFKYLENRIESEEWHNKYHQDKLKKATDAIEVWREKVGITNEVDESLIEHLQKDVEYHKERLQVSLLELDVLYTARDAKHDKHHQIISAQ